MNTQAKAISEVIKDFEHSLGNLRPSTRRVYVAGARAAIRAAGLEIWQSTSLRDLLALIGKFPNEKRARIAPFLDFLGGGEPKQSLSGQDCAALRTRVIQMIAKQMRSVKNPSIARRRDLGLIASLCAAPAAVTPAREAQTPRFLSLSTSSPTVQRRDSPPERQTMTMSGNACPRGA